MFTLAMLNKVNPAENYPQAVCICPTRELARQIFDVVKQMGQFTDVKLQIVVPDADGATDCVLLRAPVLLLH